MQLVSGGSLAERGCRCPSPTRSRSRAELCAALAYAHGRGIVHRDIKPENVLIGDDGRAQALATSASRALVDPTPRRRPATRPSVVLGTPGYMAPEARAGARPDPRMDVYARRRAARPHADRAPPRRRAPRRASGAAAAVPPALAAGDRARDRRSIRRAARRTRRRWAPSWPRVAARFKPARAAPTFDLPPEERVWRGAVALLAAVATAVALYAALVSLTPRAMAADDDAAASPRSATSRSRDGRVLTRARFEVWPTLGAAVAIAIALAAYGLLRRHWRAAGLERPAPDRPLVGARRVLRIGVVLFALFLLHEAAGARRRAAVVSYIPVIGGCFELLMLVASGTRRSRRSRPPLAGARAAALAGARAGAVPADLQHGVAARTLLITWRGRLRPVLSWARISPSGKYVEWMFTYVIPLSISLICAASIVAPSGHARPDMSDVT